MEDKFTIEPFLEISEIWLDDKIIVEYNGVNHTEYGCVMSSCGIKMYNTTPLTFDY